MRPQIQVLMQCAVWGLLLTHAGAFAEGPRSLPAPETLHVRHLNDGRWIAWTENRNQRIRIAVPQDREAIAEFARKYEFQVEWLGNIPVAPASGDRPPARVAPATDEATGPMPIERVSGQVADGAPRPAASPMSSAIATAPAGARPNGAAPLSEAEQVTKLETAIATAEKRLIEIRNSMSNPEGEYQKSQAEFKEIGVELENQKSQIARLREAGKKAELTEAEEDAVALDKKLSLARERFNLAIMTQKTQQEQILALQDKIRQDRQALDKLVGQKTAPATEANPPAAESTSSTPAGAPQATPTASPGVSAGSNTSAAAAPAKAPPLPAAAPTASESAAAANSPAPTPPEKHAGETVVATRDAIKDAKLLQAEQQADQKMEEAREAEIEAQSVSDRIASIDKNIALEQKLYDAARKKADIIFQQRRTQQEEYHAKSIEGALRAELQQLSQKLQETETLFQQTRSEVNGHADRLKELQDERTELQADEIAALTEAQQKAADAETAAGKVTELKNPYSIQNLTQWCLDHGLKISLILLVMYVLRSLVTLGNRRIVALMIHTGHGTTEEREARASTLMGVFHNASTVSITIGGGLMIFEEAGVPVGTLMGSAAILGLAVAFGAQNLIRDYFYGFVILLENQYKINDVLKIGEISGQVERITLRMTVLRDLEGRVHFIPNGKIDSVTNMTHGWSRAVFEIGVAYKEDVDRVMGVLMELARGLKREPQYAVLILEEPEMLGVDALADSAVIIKFVIKTRPLRQWQVKRELLRRIKRTFDELGIEIPFPHRTIYHHAEPATVGAADSVNDETANHQAAA
ncbi:MAG: mechanosensitive ion channel [Planctomycetaceae bacterium]|nr:mechanosensitive ion channel [Planctomycetaceae bacterium]